MRPPKDFPGDNNAGAAGRIAPTVDLSDEEIVQTLSLNLTSVILGCRRVAPVMSAQGSGTIVNISSVCAKYSWPGWSIYSAAKAGVERFSKGLYLEVRTSGVRVTTLTPSWGATDFCDVSGIGGHPAMDPAVRAKCTHPLELGKIVADIVETPAHLGILELTVVPTVQEIMPL
jgi:NADP-dependent 3-hydroxy acid dehydrogenase YdfG